MSTTPRNRFLSYVRDPFSHRPIVSPFLPDKDTIHASLLKLDLPTSDDPVQNEINLSHILDYEPMFMPDLTGLIFPWQKDVSRSDSDFETHIIETPIGTWTRQFRTGDALWDEQSGCPVQTINDHDFFVAACQMTETREKVIRAYYRNWRQRVGEEGVLVLGHPHPSWLGYQISPQHIFYHWQDYRSAFIKSMEALYEACLYVMTIAMEEGVDFMSDSSYGLEMTSPQLFCEMDLPYIQRFSQWTHERDGLFWYHNCGHTRTLIQKGEFNRLGADVIETIAPPPEGDNDLSESRRHLDKAICSKGNMNLQILRHGDKESISRNIRGILDAVKGYPHIFSTADAVLPGTSAENYIQFVNELREGLRTY
jgi:hypothetical protein